MIPILRALQQVYGDVPLREEILERVAADVNGKSESRPRPRGDGLLVDYRVGGVRLGVISTTTIQTWRNNIAALRQMMGIGDWQERVDFDWRRIRAKTSACCSQRRWRRSIT